MAKPKPEIAFDTICMADPPDNTGTYTQTTWLQE